MDSAGMSVWYHPAGMYHSDQLLFFSQEMMEILWGSVVGQARLSRGTLLLLSLELTLTPLKLLSLTQSNASKRLWTS